MKSSDLVGVEHQGFTILAVERHPSRHADDAGRLFYVLAYADRQNGYGPDATNGQWVTWLYDDDARREKFVLGEYLDTPGKALVSLARRARGLPLR